MNPQPGQGGKARFDELVAAMKAHALHATPEQLAYYTREVATIHAFLEANLVTMGNQHALLATENVTGKKMNLRRIQRLGRSQASLPTVVTGEAEVTSEGTITPTQTLWAGFPQQQPQPTGSGSASKKRPSPNMAQEQQALKRPKLLLRQLTNTGPKCPLGLTVSAITSLLLPDTKVHRDQLMKHVPVCVASTKPQPGNIFDFGMPIHVTTLSVAGSNAQPEGTFELGRPEDTVGSGPVHAAAAGMSVLANLGDELVGLIRSQPGTEQMPLRQLYSMLQRVDTRIFATLPPQRGDELLMSVHRSQAQRAELKAISHWANNLIRQTQQLFLETKLYPEFRADLKNGNTLGASAFAANLLKHHRHAHAVLVQSADEDSSDTKVLSALYPAVEPSDSRMVRHFFEYMERLRKRKVYVLGQTPPAWDAPNAATSASGGLLPIRELSASEFIKEDGEETYAHLSTTLLWQGVVDQAMWFDDEGCFSDIETAWINDDGVVSSELLQTLPLWKEYRPITYGLPAAVVAGQIAYLRSVEETGKTTCAIHTEDEGLDWAAKLQPDLVSNMEAIYWHLVGVNTGFWPQELLAASERAVFKGIRMKRERVPPNPQGSAHTDFTSIIDVAGYILT